MTENPFKDKKTKRTLIGLAFGYFVDQGEGMTVSALSPALKAAFGLTNVQFGWISFARNMLQSISSPFWGFIADRYSRKKVIFFGTGIWGIWTAVCGLTQNFGQFMTIRVISGIGLGCLMPATFSLIADSFPPKKRGRALGILEGVGVIGMIASILSLGFLASAEHWRYGFYIMGVLSVISGIAIWFLVDEPVRGSAEPELVGKINKENEAQYRAKLSNVPQVLKVKTIWVAILQGLSGTMPWIVMQTFIILWLENDLGIDASMATVVFGLIMVGTVISNIMGGFIGDWAEEKNQKYGRIMIGQFSVFIGIPLTYIFFAYSQNWSIWQLGFFGFFTALWISWPGKGAKEPIMQNVIEPELRSTAYAMVTFIESGFAAIAALITGSLADKVNLTQALTIMVPGPWILCGLFFTLFYFTYPKDAKSLREKMKKRAKEITESAK